MITPLSKYPPCLINELAKYGQKPTGDLEWDKCVLDIMKRRASDAAMIACMKVSNAVINFNKDNEETRKEIPDLSDPGIYELHSRLLLHIADRVVMAPQHRKFIVDDNNRQVIRFLLYYFNDSPLAEEVFPNRGYKLHKNIMLQGGVGVGKTMLMQIFSEYMKQTKNPRFFHNVSVTQMVNHYSVHNDIDSYLYNIRDSRSFQGKPENICLNDIGVENRPFYGIDTTTIIHDFLHARNEIWANGGEYDRRFAHLTTNLTTDQLKKLFEAKDAYGRVIDRFKTYNIIPLTGTSRR